MGGESTIIHHALNAGEVSPRMTGRQDQNKYLASCEKMENFVPFVLGGAYVRPGTIYVATAKTVADHPEKRLIPFIAARNAAYVLEFGYHYVRFFKDGLPIYTSGTTPLELTTPYDDAHLAELFFVESVDVMYLLHRFYSPHKIQRTSATTFTITEVNFDPPATIEDEPTGTDLGAGTLTLGATTGTGINATAASAVWLGTGTASGDVGRLIISGAGRAVIKSITSTTVAVVDIIDDFASVGPIAAGDWRLRLSPQTSIDINNDIRTKGQTLTVTSTNPAFRTGDVGKTVVMYGGSGKIYNYTDASHVDVLLTATLKDVTTSNPDPTFAWTLEVNAWSDTLGWPSCGCFFQERLFLCKGLTVNGSKSGDYENFAKGSDDDDAIARTISDDTIDVIVWIKGYKTLKIGSGSQVFEVTATSQSGALTPASFKVDPVSAAGAARIAPLRVTPVLVYVQTGQRELLELAYSFADDTFKSPKLFRLADHLIDGYFLTEIHYSSIPDSIIWALRNDGVLLGCAYEQIESVIGWFRIITDGTVKSLCVIPRSLTGKDWLWQCVERDNGVFIEYFEPDGPDTNREWNDIHTDCAQLTEITEGQTVITGLARLNGQTVRVIGDGMLFQDQIVSSGEISLVPDDVPVRIVEVGLPYDAVLVPVEPVVAAESGGPFIARGYAEIGVRIRRALGLALKAYRVLINEPSEVDNGWIGEQLVYRKPYHLMDRQIPLQRGKKCIINLGYDPFSRIEIRQALPFPAEVLNVVGKLHIGDRWQCDTYNDNEEEFNPTPPDPPDVLHCFPELQSLTEVAYLGAQIDIDNGAICSSVGFIEANSGGEKIHELAIGSSDGRTMFVITNGVITNPGAPGFLSADFASAICPNVLTGNADRPAFLYGFNGIHLVDFDASTDVVQNPSGSNTNHNTATRRVWALGGNNFYTGWATRDDATGICVVKFNAATGAYAAKSVGHPDWRAPQSLGVDSSGRVYYLIQHVGPPITQHIYVYDGNDLSEIAHYDLAANYWNAMAVLRPELVYLIRSAASPPDLLHVYVDLHYIKNIFTSPQEVTVADGVQLSLGDAVDVGQNFGLWAHVINGELFLYYGQSANGAIHKFGPIVCP